MKHKKNMNGSLPASFTVEAAVVIAVVLWSLGFMIREAYILYDEVTGSMILEEALENARYSPLDQDCEESLAREGEKQGNPRLWLGNYKIIIEKRQSSVKGKAVSGDWETQIEMKRHHPERFLRRIQALLEERSKPE